MVKSAYIHIPFCKSKCHYCSFVSFSCLHKKENYLKALENDILNYYQGEFLETLYIGGGTPSVLKIEEIEAIIKLFNFSKCPEITVELNPDDVDVKFLESLYRVGVNRISLGCQTFDENILKTINRRHSADQVEAVVKLAQFVGFKNISLDFIYGLPNQSEESFIFDLKRAVGLGIQHISLYALKIEEGCYFYNNLPENLPDEDLQADMYLSAVRTLQELNFVQYEVSNFSKEGLYSRHNMNYWNNEEYYGFGVSAHGYVDGVRYENKIRLDDYIGNSIDKISQDKVSAKARLEEEIFLGLRKMSGIDVSLINQKFGIVFDEKYSKQLNKYLNLKLLKKTQKGYALTIDGILVSNVVLADFLEEF